MSTQDSKKRKRKGIIFTTGVHVVVVILFCIFGFDVIDPKKGAVEVEWEIEGVVDAGGKIEDESVAQKLSDKIQNSSAASAKASAQQEEALITDESSDVSVKSTPVKEPVKKIKEVTVNDSKKENPKEAEIPKKKSPSSDLQKLLEETAKKRGEGKPKDEGVGNGENHGAKGNPKSKGTSPNGGNPGGGGDGRWIVAGRKPIKINQKKNNCNKTGKVDVYIKINRQGNVIYAVDRGGTTQDICLIKKALEQANAIKYAPSNTINEGTITIDLGL